MRRRWQAFSGDSPFFGNLPPCRYGKLARSVLSPGCDLLLAWRIEFDLEPT